MSVEITRRLDDHQICSYNVVMSGLRFEWNPEKAEANRKKHGVTFEEARSVFYDDHAIEFYDDEHSEWEDRFLLLGLSANMRLLLICHCYRDSENVIRVVSARKATKSESAHYWR